MKTVKIETKEELLRYFELDADMLSAVQNGEITGIEIIIDETKKYAAWKPIEKTNTAIETQDDYQSVIDFLKNEILEELK